MKSKWCLIVIGFLLGCSAPQMEDREPISPSPSPTMTATQTETPEPTATITYTPTLTETPYPTRTPFPFPTPHNYFYKETSPNGEWIAWHRADVELMIKGVNNNKSWLYREGAADAEYTQAYTVPMHWSVDGKYLYIGVVPPVSGIFAHGGWLARLDLESGNVIGVGNSD